MIRHLEVDSPVGHILLVANENILTRLEFVGQQHARGIPRGSRSGSTFLTVVRKQLSEYFLGQRRVFDIPLNAIGTDFQQSVWRLLEEIPWGMTRSYGGLACSLHSKGASRAVGAANGQNPISVIIPCHRVIGQNGAITGYAGGLEAKRWLLRHESIQCEKADEIPRMRGISSAFQS